MLDRKNLSFSTSIGVLYNLKEKHGHTKLQETYDYLGNGHVDTIYELLLVAYNKQNRTQLTEAEFADLLDEKNIGFVSASSIFTELVEAIMYSGLSPEEINERKNQLKNQIKI